MLGLLLVAVFCLSRRNPEGISAVVAAHSGVWRVQGCGALSRLLVLDIARASGAISASVEAKSGA
jgi:hypothetical protein